MDVELTVHKRLLTYSRESTDQDGGINSQEYANYRSFAWNPDADKISANGLNQT